MDMAALAGAVILAALGGEAFLKGVLGAARHLRVPKLLVATTLAALATSSPELTVSTMAALAGKPEIGLGDALGSNVVNIALIFGLALLFGPIKVAKGEGGLGRDFGLALLVPLLLLWFVVDGRLSQSEGALLLLGFAGWLAVNLRAVARHRELATTTGVDAEPLGTQGTMGALMVLVWGVGGLAALIAAGHLFVTGATGIATALGLDAYVIGATVVAVGTSLPELVTVILARLRGHDDVGVGTLLGSNLFNSLVIVGTAASIHPVQAPLSEITVTLGCGIAALCLLVPNRADLIPRSRGLLLLMLYGGFVWLTLVTGRNLLFQGLNHV